MANLFEEVCFAVSPGKKTQRKGTDRTLPHTFISDSGKPAMSTRRVNEPMGLSGHPFGMGDRVVCVTRSGHFNGGIHSDAFGHDPKR